MTMIAALSPIAMINAGFQHDIAHLLPTVCKGKAGWIDGHDGEAG
jgi:hypothetical protein